MRVVVIGGTGHIGTYLVPSLMKAGHDTVVISRGSRRAYRDDPVWRDVEMMACDRGAAEQDGRFGTVVAGLRPDAVVDLTCFTPAQARQLVDALDGQHIVQTGSVWSYGPSAMVPTTEDAPKHPYGVYGVNKLAIEKYLTGAQDRVRASVVQPGHISGPGWMPIGPAGPRPDRDRLAPRGRLLPAARPWRRDHPPCARRGRGGTASGVPGATRCGRRAEL